MKKLFTLFLLLCINFLSFGAYLENVPTQLVQANGEVLHLFITGDEFYRRVHDSEGYSIVPGNDGWYYYALYDLEQDKLVPSEFKVTMNRNFELPMAKGLGISQESYLEKRRIYFEPTGCCPSGIPKNSILKDLANNGVKTTQQMNNIVICIGFADTEEMTNSFSYVDGLFNSNENNSMRDYFAAMSYNKLDIVSHFYPQPEGNVLRFYKDVYPRNYYQPYSPSNPIGYDPHDWWDSAEREQMLLSNAIEWVNANDPIPTELNLDINNDGYCDFISFVVQGNVGEWAELLWPHKWSLFLFDTYINGKQVWDYNFELDGTPVYFSSNVFCHEGYHVLGAPDLYHYYNYTSLKAVNTWDIMDYSYLTKPQSMSAYMKYQYGHWISALPIATINRTYEVFPFYYNDGSDPEKPIIYRIPMTGAYDQYSVVEYRKKTGTNYDAYLPNEGFLIYRINASMNGNAGFDAYSTFDEVYLYRTGSSQTGGVYTQGDLDQAPYNKTNGKTAFNNTTDPKPCQSNGTAENIMNINNILYDDETDSYTFFYGDPENRTLSVDKTELVLDYLSGSTGTIKITSSVLWHISIPANAADWLTVSKTKGLNDETLTFTTLSTNNAEEQRTTMVALSYSEQTLYVTVIQEIFDNNIVVTVIPNPTEGGSVTGGGIYNIGDEVTVTATPNNKYIFQNWACEDTIITSNASYTFIAIEHIVLVANFEKENIINDYKQLDKYRIYPNPANNELYVTSDEFQMTSIEIFDVLGRKLLVHNLVTSLSNYKIDISALCSGFYFIKIIDEQGFSTQRFVKE